MPLFGTARLRDAFQAALGAAREKHRFRLLAWVIMPEHVHLAIVARPVLAYRDGLALLASNSTVKIMTHNLKRRFAERVIHRWVALRAPVLPRITHPDGTRSFWQTGGGFDRNVRNEAALWRTIRYIHSNPVEEGLVTRAEDWAWSSARWYAGQVEGQLPIDLDYHTKWYPPQNWMEEAIESDPSTWGPRGPECWSPRSPGDGEGKT